MARKRIQELLVPPFPKKNISAALRHYTEAVDNFEASRWEDCLFKIGKLVEAILKALCIHVGEPLPSGRGFKADVIINALNSKSQGAFDDSVRILIPRACRFIYDIASNRGGRHDPEEISANEMDASVSVPVCSWILAEMIRVAQKGSVDLEDARTLVDALTAKKYPNIEEIEGRIYFHFPNISATDVAFLVLAHRHPKRISKQDLIKAIGQNHFSVNNARMAVQRINRFMDNDGNDQLRLLIPGLRKAEGIMKRGLSGS